MSATHETTKYRDGQITSKITTAGDLDLVIRGISYEDLFGAASVKEAWDNSMVSTGKFQKDINYSTLTITCLIGQRSDRRFYSWSSFDLKVIARFINSMNFNVVRILHPHSSVLTALIDNCYVIDHSTYVEKAIQDSKADCLVSPDAGAYKDTIRLSERYKTPMIASNKYRDSNGDPQISVIGDVSGKDLLIVDDCADGGRTFVALAKSLKEQGARTVSLYVSHGMFHYGFEELKEYIDHVYCTNSYRDIKDDFVTQYKIY